MKDNYNIDIDQLRNMVQSRQFIVNSDGTYATDEYGRLINNLTSPSAEDPSRSVIDVLLDQINVFKSLQ
jgi:hypothetical protein